MNKKKNIVVYTAIFGGKDDIILPEFLPENADFVCFTDSDITSDVWDVRREKPISDDPVRSAKIYKVLPHKFLSEYEYSVWIDGNILLRGDVNKLIEKYLVDGVNLAIFDHMQHKKRWKKIFWIKNTEDCRDCVYDEAQYLLRMNKDGKYKDDPNLIVRQISKYKKDGYPKHNGLAVTMIILRRHNEPDVMKVMDDWWDEIKNNSRRDQLSFNYVAWKNNLNFVYMKGDSRRNKYFLHTRHKIDKYER